MNNTNTKKIMIKFLILQFFYLVSSAAIFSFATALFNKAGVEQLKITTSCSIETACSFVGMLVIGAFCSKIGKIKLPLIFFLLASLVIYTLLYFFTNNPLLPLIYGTIGFLYDPVTALIDSWILNKSGNEVKNFAKIRTASLFVYSLFYILLGILISKFGYIVCLITVFVTLTVCIIIALTIPDIAKEELVGEIKEKEPFKSVFKKEVKVVGIFLVIAFFLGLCCTSLLSYTPMILTSIAPNGTSNEFYQGLGLFLCYIGNSLFCILSIKLEKVNPLKRFILCAVVMITALLLITFFKNVPVLLVSNFLRGAADALFVVTFREYVNKEVPSDLKTFSQSMCNAFHGSLGGSVGMLLTGFLYNKFMLPGMTLFCISAGIISIGICLIVMFIRNKKIKKDELVYEV